MVEGDARDMRHEEAAWPQAISHVEIADSGREQRILYQSSSDG
jgi:hypothetical protein